ncbi:MAG: GT4 family glycosyltransferase PelF [Anaerolineae bacterium]|jgi:glycosyltransferase involved in cell wall biosynthesis|nr:GT4 family glycosyltransferase PelF [Anaerolineae bacterium]
MSFQQPSAGLLNGDTWEDTGVRPASLSVCLVTEGTYPYYRGGVSTWCDMLVRGLPEVRFVLVSMVADPSASPVYELPENVVELIPVPLWGTGEVLELRRDLSVLNIWRCKRSAPSQVIRRHFLPPFREFIRALWQLEPCPGITGEALQQLSAYFDAHDYDTTLRSQLTWECFLQEVTSGFENFCRAQGVLAQASLLDATDALRLLYRWLTILTVNLPAVDVIHAAASGLCSIPGIVSRQTGKAAFLLTEHGVYLRERLLGLTRSEGSWFNQVVQAQFARRITEASYLYADQIAPGSNYNHRWELHNGAPAERIQTIYNGPDPAEFTPAARLKALDAAPTIAWVGRIDPLKDLETLIHAAVIVREHVPHVRFVLYGKAPKGNESYYERCLNLREEFGLQDTLIFAGYAASAEAAYNEGDFVVLSSISEGFPYSVVEAMMCGRTVVGTDVGGVREALEGCGVVVEPRNPEQLAQACLQLLRDPVQTRILGEMARQKALTHFSLQQCNAAYLATYQRLATTMRHLQSQTTRADVAFSWRTL